MKNILSAAIIALLLFFAASCKKNEYKEANSGGNVVVIREKLFMGQVYDIYLNANDYVGKTIKLEGVFLVQEAEEQAEPYRMIVRYGPGGCCGVDGLVGFEVAWERPGLKYPENNSWVEATGVLKQDKSFFPYIELLSLNVLDKRGAEFVSQ
jgi:uncharacterized membrane protein YcgQ (UPF0703/DUF1980 family)